MSTLDPPVPPLHSRPAYGAVDHGSTRELVLWTWEHYPRSREDLTILQNHVEARCLELQGFRLEELSALDLIALKDKANLPAARSIIVMANSLRKAIEAQEASMECQLEPTRGPASGPPAAVTTDSPAQRTAAPPPPQPHQEQEPCVFCNRS